MVTENSLVTTTEYLNGFQYVNSLMQFFPHAEGYVNATQNGAGYDYKYVFNYTDHLGNIRLSYAEDPTSKVLKIIVENHYYPFGLKHSGYNSDKMMYVREALVLKIKPVTPFLKTSYDYKYNGKEWQDELGLNMYDYGARNYDTAIGRWMNIDPLAETSRRYTPYAYALDNPVFFIDPDGMQAIGADGLTNEQWVASMGSLESQEESKKGNKETDNKETENKETENKSKTNNENPPKTLWEWFKSVIRWKVKSNDEYDESESNRRVFNSMSEDVKKVRELEIQILATLVTLPIGGEGGGAIKIISVVKSDTKLLSYAVDALESSPILRKEINALLKQAANGNFDAGIGKNIITKTITEMRGKNGARIYYQMEGKIMKIIGYSSKNNQPEVINRLIKIYGK